MIKTTIEVNIIGEFKGKHVREFINVEFQPGVSFLNFLKTLEKKIKVKIVKALQKRSALIVIMINGNKISPSDYSTITLQDGDSINIFNQIIGG